MLSKCQIEEMQKSWFTCLLDCGWGLCNGGLFADSTLVLGKGPEDVGVTHDQVWNSGIHSVIMLQYCEPVLWRQQLRSVNFRHDYRVNSSFHHGTMSKNNATAMDHVRKLVIVEKALYPCLFVSLLDGVSGDCCVSVILGFGPLQSNIETPGVHDLDAGWRSRQLWWTGRQEDCWKKLQQLGYTMMCMIVYNTYQQSAELTGLCPQSCPLSHTSHTRRSRFSLRHGWRKCCPCRCCGYSPF